MNYEFMPHVNSVFLQFDSNNFPELYNPVLEYCEPLFNVLESEKLSNDRNRTFCITFLLILVH